MPLFGMLTECLKEDTQSSWWKALVCGERERKGGGRMLGRASVLHFSLDLLSSGFLLCHEKELLFASATFFPIIIISKLCCCIFLFANNVLTIIKCPSLQP